jgi:hypothetical protein
MENLIDVLIRALLVAGSMAFLGTYAIGLIGLRAAVNGCVAVFGASSFAIWARGKKGKTFPPKVGPSPHDDKSDDEKPHAS